MSLEIQLNPNIDLEKYARIYAEKGRVHIPNILTEKSARYIENLLIHHTPWRTNFNDGEKGHTLYEEQIEAMNDVQRDMLNTHVKTSAIHGFQYVFNAYSLSDTRENNIEQDLEIQKILDFVNTKEYLDFARIITAEQGVDFADAQCTLYRAGHFLTDHLDDVKDKRRFAAMVFNFTNSWRTDWGGILQFIDDDGHISQGIMPVFNSLNLLKVPQKHSVSYVAPHAEGGRYSVTGWLRAGKAPTL